MWQLGEYEGNMRVQRLVFWRRGMTILKFNRQTRSSTKVEETARLFFEAILSMAGSCPYLGATVGIP